MIPLEEAQKFVLGSCDVLGTAEVPLLDALGLTCAEDVRATDPIPPQANTAMDGFAVRADDTAQAPSRLRLVGSLAAGSAEMPQVRPGQAVRIMTGAPIPPGADAIVIVEDTVTTGEWVEVRSAASRGDHIRPGGSDVQVGDVVVARTTELRPAHLGLLASVGREQVAAVRRPVVGVLSTGDELVQGGTELLRGQIRDSNRPSLLASVRASGFQAMDLGCVPDEPDAIRRALSAGVEKCDAILTSGGVSVGDYDYTKAVLDSLSDGSMRWMQVAIKPAKPFAFGVVKDVPVFGLPGNPVSSLVSFECFARPALRKMAGFSLLHRPRVTALAAEDFRRRRDGKLHLLRVVAEPDSDGRFRVRSSGGQSSHQLSAMGSANALALLADGEGLMAGDSVDTLLLYGC
ncbi:MAG: molybdopterin molybdotransferase MoeA [Actinomycetota bacterium]|nr:molybdopterin molybdotransferase MoeA [Actinomycetota bacterium]